MGLSPPNPSVFDPTLRVGVGEGRWKNPKRGVSNL